MLQTPPTPYNSNGVHYRMVHPMSLIGSLPMVSVPKPIAKFNSLRRTRSPVFASARLDLESSYDGHEEHKNKEMSQQARQVFREVGFPSASKLKQVEPYEIGHLIPMPSSSLLTGAGEYTCIESQPYACTTRIENGQREDHRSGTPPRRRRQTNFEPDLSSSWGPPCHCRTYRENSARAASARGNNLYNVDIRDGLG